MIFVTVGSSLAFDALVEKAEELAGSMIEPVVIQRGNGKYVPKHVSSFRFAKSLDSYYKDADIIISACGAGTIMENVVGGRKLIVVENPDIKGGHEWELISKLEKMGCLIWCRVLDDLAKAVRKARTKLFSRFDPDRLDVEEVVDCLDRGK